MLIQLIKQTLQFRPRRVPSILHIRTQPAWIPIPGSRQASDFGTIINVKAIVNTGSRIDDVGNPCKAIGRHRCVHHAEIGSATIDTERGCGGCEESEDE